VLLNRLLSLDGKSIKCTSSGGNSSQQNFTSLVSVYDDQAAGVVQLQIMQNQKTSEIGVAQQLISDLAQLPSGQILSLDALHTQTATVAAIADSGHDYLITVKRNQPTLYRAIESTAQTQSAISHASVVVIGRSPIVSIGLKMSLLMKIIPLVQVVMLQSIGRFCLLGSSHWSEERVFGLFLKLYICGLIRSKPFFLFLYETTLPAIHCKG
jgi:Transposase DDE domain